MTEVIRFDIYFRGGVPEVLPSLDGRYMRFDDHEKANARIAELTAEVASVTSQKEAQAKMWANDLAMADGLRKGLNQVIVASMMTNDTNAIADIARNALKGGV